jgi:hypothetical protein
VSGQELSLCVLPGRLFEHGCSRFAPKAAYCRSVAGVNTPVFTKTANSRSGRRHQIEAEREGTIQCLYPVDDYEAVASIPIGGWLEARRRELLPTPYGHVVFILPRELAPLRSRRCASGCEALIQQ